MDGMEIALLVPLKSSDQTWLSGATRLQYALLALEVMSGCFSGSHLETSCSYSKLSNVLGL